MVLNELLENKRDRLLNMSIKARLLLLLKRRPTAICLSPGYSNDILQLVLQLLKQNGITPNLFCCNYIHADSDLKDTAISFKEMIDKWGRNINIIMVYGINHPNDDFVSLVSDLFIDVNSIYTWLDICSIMKIQKKPIGNMQIFAMQEINRFADKIQSVINILSDEKSKNAYLSLLSLRCYDYQFDFSPYLLLQEHDQYFNRRIIEISEEEVFVDAGVGFGDTIFNFLEVTKGKYRHIYAFEANTQFYDSLLPKIRCFDNITVYNKGLYNFNGTMGFDADGMLGSCISESGSNEIETVKGDDCDIKPTFIKMDIEGAELKALQGFEQTIKKYKPKLAICIYHKLEDFWEIPLYIKEIVPQYKLYVCHHGAQLSESVLYATL